MPDRPYDSDHTGTYDGIEYRYEYVQAFDDWDEIRISVPAEGTSTFEFHENDEVSEWVRRIGALISGKSNLKSDDLSFDKKVKIGRVTNSTLALLKDPEFRKSVETLLDLGFTRVRRYGSRVEATWLPGYKSRVFEATIVLPDALPIMVELALARPNCYVQSAPAFADRMTAEKTATPVTRKGYLATWILASLLVVPGYWYVGGWRYAFPVAALWFPVYYLVDALPRDLGVFALSTFIIVGVWKAVVACALRNKLTGKNAVSAGQFDSSQYGIYALADLVLGLGMGASACASFLLLERLHTVPVELTRYLVAVPLAVWAAELMLGYALLRLAGPLNTQVNPFLEQQYLRWRINRTHEGAGQMARQLPVLWFFPSWREAVRALLLPLFIGFFAMVNAR